MLIYNTYEWYGIQRVQNKMDWEELFLPLMFVLLSHSPEATTVAFLMGVSRGALLISTSSTIWNVTLVRHLYEEN